MFFKKRKKDITWKLRYLGRSEEQIENVIKTNYAFYGILTGSHLIIEIDVNDSYYLLQRELSNIEKNKIDYKKDILNTQDKYSISPFKPCLQ